MVGDRISAKVEAAVNVTKVELCYTTQDGKWQDRKWEAEAITVPDKSPPMFSLTSKIPAGARVVYWNVEDERGLVSSSEHLELPASAP